MRGTYINVILDLAFLLLGAWMIVRPEMAIGSKVEKTETRKKKARIMGMWIIGLSILLGVAGILLRSPGYTFR